MEFHLAIVLLLINMHMKNIFLLLSALFAWQSAVSQQVLKPQDVNSKVQFVIKNLGFKTGGDLTGLKGSIRFDPRQYANSAFDVTVDAATIDTDNNTRDGHLRGEEYFDAEKFPLIRFQSTKVMQSTKSGRFYMYGNLTIKGVTKPVEFGFGATPKDGGFVFDGSFQINRRDFGVGGSSVTLSDKLTVKLNVFAK